jgi:hypothetical protein
MSNDRVALPRAMVRELEQKFLDGSRKYRGCEGLLARFAAFYYGRPVR